MGFGFIEKYVVVGLAGAIGSIARYYVGLLIAGWWAGHFPFGTLIANYIGCFCLSWFMVQSHGALRIPDWARAGIATGFLGSFTTFSAFSVETVELAQHGQWLSAAVYVLLSLWGGLGLAWLGFTLASDGRKDVVS